MNRDQQEQTYSQIETEAETVQIRELINTAWDILTREYPHLSEVIKEEAFPTSDELFKFTAGIFEPPQNNSEKPLVRIVLGDTKHIEDLLIEREVSNRIVANLLGVPFKKMDAKILQVFIVLHEAGHAHDFIVNYRNGSVLEEENPLDVWDEHSDASLESLPFPGFFPSDLKLKLQDFETFEAFLEQFPALQEKFNRNNIHSFDQLLNAQERGYRALPQENYADNFAAQFMRKHWEEIGFDSAVFDKVGTA